MLSTTTETILNGVYTAQISYASTKLATFYENNPLLQYISEDSINLQQWYNYSFRYNNFGTHYGDRVFQFSSIESSFTWFEDWSGTTTNDLNTKDALMYRYPWILYSATTLGLGLSDNPCAPFTEPTPKIDFQYLTPNISFEFNTESHGIALFSVEYPINPYNFETTNFSYTSNGSNLWPAYIPLNISGSTSEEELKFLHYQWTKYLNFSDEEVHPCIFNFDNSLFDDMQYRVGHGQFPFTPPPPINPQSSSSTKNPDNSVALDILPLAPVLGVILIFGVGAACSKMRKEESQSLLSNPNFAQRFSNSLINGAKSISNLFGCKRKTDELESEIFGL